jgi:hypothetical protein
VYAEAVGRKNDVSNEISGPSGKAMDCTEGEARKTDDPYGSSVLAAHRDSRIDRLRGTCVRVLRVDSATDESNDVIGSVSGVAIGEGPGKGSGADLRDLGDETGKSEGTREGLATDPGSGTSLAIAIVDTDEDVVLSMSEGELIVGEPGRG